MKFIYPAIFSKTTEGTFEARFPDLECCTATGETLDDCIENANQAAYDWIYVELTEFDSELPPITTRMIWCSLTTKHCEIFP